MALISVIVPVYKVEKFLNRCVDSILAQTFTDFELILVDDGSPDNCGIICDAYAEKDSRVIVIHKENGGHSDSRNTGIDWCFKSNSKWITFIDSDDYVHPDYLSVLLRLCMEYNVNVSACGCIKFDNDSEVNFSKSDYEMECGKVKDLLYKYKNFRKFNVSVIWGRLYKKELFVNVRFPIGRYFEDEFVVYKILYGCKMIAITTTGFYYYYRNSSGVMASHLSPKRMNDQLDSLKEQVDFYVENEYLEPFQRRFWYYCSLVEKYLKEYGKDKEYQKYLLIHKKNIMRCIHDYKVFLPDLLIKYGYKKWISQVALMREGFKKEVYEVKAQKGRIYSLLWAIKNYSKYKSAFFSQKQSPKT